MKTITIVSKKHGTHQVLIDDEDFERVNQFNWYVCKRKYTFYAMVHNPKSTKNIILLHRFILRETNPKVLIDHKNHNGLDCQKLNIRRCTASENLKNRRSIGSSKYLGVS